MVVMSSSPCEAAGEELDAGEHEPSGCAGDRRLEVLGEATVAGKPGKGALDHPAPRLGLESPDALASRDDIDRPGAQIGECIEQLLPPIDAGGDDMAQLGEHSSD